MQDNLPSISQSIWRDPAKVERLRELWDQKWSCSRIGKELGVSRCAVIGKAHRLGLEARRRTTEGPKLKRKAPRPKTRVTLTEDEPRFAPAPFRPKAADVVPLNIPFNELEAGQCRFIPGDPAYDAPCCGNPVDGEGRPYCAGHASILYKPNRKHTDVEKSAAHLATIQRNRKLKEMLEAAVLSMEEEAA